MLGLGAFAFAAPGMLALLLVSVAAVALTFWWLQRPLPLAANKSTWGVARGVRWFRCSTPCCSLMILLTVV